MSEWDGASEASRNRASLVIAGESARFVSAQSISPPCEGGVRRGGPVQPITHVAGVRLRLSLRLIAALLVITVGCLSPGLTARGQETPPPAAAPTAAVGTRRALVVCGLPGDDDHRKLFADDGREASQSALTSRYGFAASGSPGAIRRREPDRRWPRVWPRRGGCPTARGSRPMSTSCKKRLRPDDTLWVIVVGHTHYDGRHSHLNLPGPDLDERAVWQALHGTRRHASRSSSSPRPRAAFS